ncbi:MAG: AI-2E family transporter [Bacilli bacterium]|nr:AI-2E family transporter [Bacilli bacterium]
MFKKRESKEIDKTKINEVTDLASRVLKVTYFLLLALSLYLILILCKETYILSIIWTIIKIVAPLFIGILIAWLFDPFVKWLQTKKIKRSFGALITYVILFLIVFIILAALIPLLTNQIGEFVRMAPGVFDSIKLWCLGLFDHIRQIDYIDSEAIKAEFFSKFNEFAADITKKLPTQLIGIISGFFSGMGTLVLGLIIGFFLLVSFDSTSSLKAFIPKRVRETSMDLINDVNNSLRKYVQGALIDCSVIFILTSVGLWLIGLKAPALFGFFCGLTNIIPYIGPYIGGAPAAIVGFTQSPTIGVLTIVVIAVIQFLEGNFLQPYIMSKTTKLHPVTIMLGLLIFGYFFGMLGMLISTPLIAVIKTIFQFFDKKYGIINREEINLDADINEELDKIKESVKKEK